MPGCHRRPTEPARTCSNWRTWWPAPGRSCAATRAWPTWPRHSVGRPASCSVPAIRRDGAPRAAPQSTEQPIPLGGGLMEELEYGAVPVQALGHLGAAFGAATIQPGVEDPFLEVEVALDRIGHPLRRGLVVRSAHQHRGAGLVLRLG